MYNFERGTFCVHNFPMRMFRHTVFLSTRICTEQFLSGDPRRAHNLSAYSFLSAQLLGAHFPQRETCQRATFPARKLQHRASPVLYFSYYKAAKKSTLFLLKRKKRGEKKQKKRVEPPASSRKLYSWGIFPGRGKQKKSEKKSPANLFGVIDV